VWCPQQPGRNGGLAYQPRIIVPDISDPSIDPASPHEIARKRLKHPEQLARRCLVLAEPRSAIPRAPRITGIRSRIAPQISFGVVQIVKVWKR
jgi:hypothetical protein